jgi:hypothetical protein
MSIEYGHEQFSTAVYGCVSSTEPLQKRLSTAFMYNLIQLGPDNVPAEVWEELQKLRATVTAVPAVGNEGSIEATTSKMTEEQAAKCLEQIVSMFSDVTEAYGVDMYKAENRS